MFAALAKLWTALGKLFEALDTGATSVNNLAKVGENMTLTLLDESNYDRQIALLAQKKKLLLASE